MGRWTVLDEIAIADCTLEVEGETLNDLFETAVLALADVMVDPATVTETIERAVTLTAPAIDLLLHDWLSELIYVKDSERIVFTHARVRVEEGAACTLHADVTGGQIDPPRTALRADPKAVTFHQFAIGRRAGGWYARVVVDI